MSPIRPGETMPAAGAGSVYTGNAYHLSEGKRLFSWFNCVGCHSHGGGGSGPALMDDQWIYGSEIQNIVATIEEGRPNGMPSFRGKIPDDQVWEIAAYVRSLSGLESKDAAPSRADHMQAKPAENRMPTPDARTSGVPPSASMPQ
jgi:cytochrome c oxidase cbb3-type subunit 3